MNAPAAYLLCLALAAITQSESVAGLGDGFLGSHRAAQRPGIIRLAGRQLQQSTITCQIPAWSCPGGFILSNQEYSDIVVGPCVTDGGAGQLCNGRTDASATAVSAALSGGCKQVCDHSYHLSGTAGDTDGQHAFVRHSQGYMLRIVVTI